MRQAQYETTTDVQTTKLLATIADIGNWNKWDAGLKFTKIEGVAKAGVGFVLNLSLIAYARERF